MSSFSEKTFSTQNYLQARAGRYPPALFSAVLSYHSSKSSSNHLAVDLGCGPGTVTNVLSQFFDKVVGVDASESMIETAKGNADAPNNVQYHIGSANKLPFIGDAEVDLVVSATAAHYFPASWWEEARRVTKIGGTVAVWTYFTLFVDPAFHPNAGEASDLYAQLSERCGFSSPGAQIAKSLYDDLPLPSTDLMQHWSGVTRMKWDTDWKSITDPEGKLFSPSNVTLKDLRAQAASHSAVHDWRQRHPEIAFTEDDVVTLLIRDLKLLLGVDEEDTIPIGWNMGLVMLTRLSLVNMYEEESHTS